MSQTIIATYNNSNCDFVGMYHNQTVQSIKQYRKFFSKIKTIGDECLHKDVTTIKISSEIGWSPYYDGSKRTVRKYHFFPKGRHISICGHVTLTESKRKNKFIDLSNIKNPKKFCQYCIKEQEVTIYG